MDFLASFDFGNDTVQSNNAKLASLDELTQRLRSLLDAKVTATRTEHVAITVELIATAWFTLQLSASEHAKFTGASSIDPSLGGAAPNDADTEQPDRSFPRTVTVSECSMNQGQQPELQRLVARHITDALGATDGSTWTVQDVSRGPKGWKFTHVCNDSVEAWKRRTSKSHAAPVIGEYSYKDPDPVLMERPAFDCRGSITILFSHVDRSLIITYAHTPIHKTVGQLTAHYKPPQKELGPGAQKQKTPKKTPKSAKKDAAEAQDGSSRPRKRFKKKNGEAQPPAPQNPDLTIVNSADPMQIDDAVDHQTSNPTAAVSAQPQAQPSTVRFLSINVTPAEAARRREAARSMLSGAGVDPNSLSVDQFNIFSNQSPELQKESLNMLVKYGAERLRIVHPGNSEATASATASNSSSPVHVSQVSASEPTTTKELVPRPQVAEGSAPAVNADPQTTPKTKTKTRGGKSRVACMQCKQRKTKCPHEKPTCAECQGAGLICEYPAPKPRNKKNLSEAVVSLEDDGNNDDVEIPEQIPQEQLEQAQPQQHNYPEPPPHSTEFQQDYSQQFVTNGPALEHPGYSSQPYPPTNNVDMPMTQTTLPGHQPSQAAYFHSATGLASPRQEPSTVSYNAGLAVPQGQRYPVPQHEAPQHTVSPQPAEATAAENTPRRKKGARKTLVDSPQVRDDSKRSASQPRAHNPPQQAETAVGRTTPDQASARSILHAPPPQTRYQPGQNGQRRVPLGEQSNTSPYQQSTPSQQTTQFTNQEPHATSGATDSHRNQAQDADNVDSTNSQSAQRIAYVPYSQQQQRSYRSSSYQNHDYSRDPASTMNVSAPGTTPLNQQDPVAQASRNAQWSGSQGRELRNQTSHSHYSPQPFTSQSTISDNVSVRDYHMHAADSQASELDHTRKSCQQTQPPQQANLRHGWYDYNNPPVNQRFTASNHQNRQYG